MKTVLGCLFLMLVDSASGFSQDIFRDMISSPSTATNHSGFYLALHSQNSFKQYEQPYNTAFPYEKVFSSASFSGDSITRTLIWKPFTITTIGVQTLTGVGALLIVAGISSSIANAQQDFGSAITVGIIAAVGGAFAFPAGVYLGGNWMGGNGSYWWTVAGCCTAGGIALLPNIMAGSGDAGATIIRTSIAVFVGSILGYHLSASPVYESAKESGHRFRGEVEFSLRQWQRNLPHEDFGVTLVSFSF